MFTTAKEYLNLSQLNKEADNTRKSLLEATIQEGKDTDNSNNMYALRESAELKTSTRLQNKRDVKTSLLSECIYKVYDKALGIQVNKTNNEAIKRNLVNEFIKENGVDTLLSNFKYKSLMLSEFSRLVTKYTNLIIEAADKSQDTEVKVDSELSTAFYDELNMDDMAEVSTAIKARVAASMEEFINSNVNDQAELKEILQNSQEKVNGTEDEDLQESYNIQCKDKMNTIRNKRNKTIFEAMIINISESAMQDESIGKVYRPNGKLDMDKIVENCELMYTFLETVNTCKIIKVDAIFIDDMLKGLKK